MKVGDKEFYELMGQFEKDVREITYGHEISRMTREERSQSPSGYFYNDGEINTLFKAYMLGYQYRQVIANLEEASR